MSRQLNALRPAIEAMAEQLVDEMVAKDAPADLEAALGFPLPVWVICDMLGVPDTDRERFAHWSDMLLSMTRYTQEEMRAGQAESGAYRAAHLDAMRERPGEDLLSALLAETGADGEPLSDRMMVATGIGLLVAGTVLPSGTTAGCGMAAANRDERRFAAADQLELRRSPNPHLAFGAGAHACIGQPLARTGPRAVLDVLPHELPSLALAGAVDDLQRVEGLVVGGLEELPVRW